jgi:hypothetical protein
MKNMKEDEGMKIMKEDDLNVRIDNDGIISFN